MNEQEKAEFERQKNRAEAQLNQMYFGNMKKTSNGSGLAMPSFLAPPKAAQQPLKSKNEGNKKPETPKPKAPTEGPKQQPKKQPLKNGNILNFLNFKGLKMDNDRLIILAVCLLLAGEETDELLMLALIYIML